MMATTHALAGLVVGAAVAALAPDLAVPALLSGAAGGLAPDLDLYADHRRHLHFPVYAWTVAVPAAAVAALAPGPLTVGVAVFLASWALHSSSDVLGGGLELRPWQATSDRGVYDHSRGRWLRPRRVIRYDGAPEDFLLGGVLGLAALAVAPPSRVLVVLVGGLLAVSTVYATIRRRIPAITEWLVAAIPPGVRRRLPERFREC